MTDSNAPDTSNPNPNPNPGATDSGGERTFTQAEVNKIVADRLARAGRSDASPATRRDGAPPPPIAPADAVKRALAFHQAGYSAAEVEAYATDTTYAAPPPPPGARAGGPAQAPVPPAVSTTAPGAGPARPAGVLVDASRLQPHEIATMTPQALVQAVGGVLASARGNSGLPVPPHLRLKPRGS